jgi:carbamoyl-phosphate synthase/aspartate carbamoyltransferase/dihydroorotase
MPSREILSKIIDAKKQGLPITCGVCPHHLFLTTDDQERLGVYGDMLPSLKTREDQEYLWEHLDDIDIFESDHAPHTRQEKEAGAHGVPGLETTLPLLLTAMKQGKITLEQIIDKCHTAPARIFGIPTDDTTSVEVDMSPYTINDENLQTKCGWSPFSGQEVYGRVTKVVLHGKTVYENSQIVAGPGDGKVITRV